MAYSVSQIAELQEVNGETALFLENGDLAIINKTGSMTIRSIAQSEGADAAAEKIARQFSITKETAKKDVLAFLEQLIDLGILHHDTV